MASDEQELDGPMEVLENSAEARVYELGFHMDPELPQEEAKKTYQALKDLITNSSGTIVAEGDPEKIALAYTISRMETTGRRDFNSAYFAWIAYEVEGSGHAALMEAMKNDPRMVRYIDLRTTKEAAHHSAEMQEIFRQAQVQAAEDAAPEEETADAELDAALKEAGV
jgi:ribosomal protein S6